MEPLPRSWLIMVSLCTILHGHGILAKIMARSWQGYQGTCHGSWQGCHGFEHWEIWRQFCAATFCRFHKHAVLILKAAETLINFTSLSMHTNFGHIISFIVASYSACYLANGDYIRYLHEKLTRENKVIAAAKKWKCFQF